MQPYEDLGGHYRETPGETITIVCMDVLALALPFGAVAAVAVDASALRLAVVLGGVGFVVWVTWLWNVVADRRGWE